jgi:glutathione S-transferase
MITLFHKPKSRSTRFIFLLEELEAPYQIKRVTIKSRDGSGGVDPENPHPHGKVPAITDDGALVFESSAIALYLTDKFRKNELGPVAEDPKRGEYLTWLAYYTGVLEPAFVSKFMKVDVPVGTAGWVAVDSALPLLVKTLGKGPYLLGEKFSAADILYGTTFAMFAGSPLLPKEPVLEDYARRCTARPAFKRALEKDEG